MGLRASFLALAALCLPAAASISKPPEAAGQEVPSNSALDPTVLRCIRYLHDPEGPSEDELTEQILAVGPLPVDDLLRLLEQGRVDAYIGMGSDTHPADGDVQLMNRYQERLICRLLGEAGMPLVVPAIERLLGRSRGVEALAAAIVGLGAVGDARQLRPLFELALPLEDPESLDPRLERALEKGAASILSSDPGGFDTFSASWRQLPSALVPAMVRAIGATSNGRGVELLGQVLVWEPDHAALAVAMMRRLGPSPDPDVNGRIAAELRVRLDPLELSFCRAAILALAELEDCASIPQLIELLETAPVLEDNALWALQKISGRSWANSPGWWRLWYEEELTWHDETHPRVARELRETAQREKRVSILREYGKRRLFRSDLAIEVIPLLSMQDRPTRLVAIETLRLLEARVGVNALIELLADDDETVREAALSALQALTGEVHPADSEAWSAMGAS